MNNSVRLNTHYILWIFQASPNGIKVTKLFSHPITIVTQCVCVIATFSLFKMSVKGIILPFNSLMLIDYLITFYYSETWTTRFLNHNLSKIKAENSIPSN